MGRGQGRRLVPESRSTMRVESASNQTGLTGYHDHRGRNRPHCRLPKHTRHRGRNRPHQRVWLCHGSCSIGRTKMDHTFSALRLRVGYAWGSTLEVPQMRLPYGMCTTSLALCAFSKFQHIVEIPKQPCTPRSTPCRSRTLNPQALNPEHPNPYSPINPIKP